MCIRDRVEAKDAARNEKAAEQLAEFWMGQPNETGLVKGRFLIPALAADHLRVHLEALTAPRHVRDYQKKRRQAEADGEGESFHRRLRGQAFTQLMSGLGDLDPDQMHGGRETTLVVTIDHATLIGELDRVGVTAFGTPVSPGEARRMACNAGILSAVLGLSLIHI